MHAVSKQQYRIVRTKILETKCLPERGISAGARRDFANFNCVSLNSENVLEAHVLSTKSSTSFDMISMYVECSYFSSERNKLLIYGSEIIKDKGCPKCRRNF